MSDASIFSLLSQNLDRKRKIKWALAVGLFISLSLLPYADVGITTLDVLMSVLIFGLAGVAFNVLLGYTGMLSFGHAAFFGGAGYAVALVMAYTGIHEILILIPVILLCSFLLSAIIGWISVQHTEATYSLLMLALAQMLYVIAHQWRAVTGGSDGMRISQPTYFGVDLYANLGYVEYFTGILYYTVLLLVGVSLVLLWLMMRGSFGVTLKAIRENDTRARAIGIPVTRYRWYSTVVSGTFTGLAGALFFFKAGHIAPDRALNWMISGEIAIMSILGGIGAFLGPSVGASVFLYLENFSAGFISEYWMFLLGVILLATILFLPQGIIVGINKVENYLVSVYVSITRNQSGDKQEEIRR
jgi:branched-chain amino acid transport system permease protein